MQKPGSLKFPSITFCAESLAIWRDINHRGVINFWSTCGNDNKWTTVVPGDFLIPTSAASLKPFSLQSLNFQGIQPKSGFIDFAIRIDVFFHHYRMHICTDFAAYVSRVQITKEQYIRNAKSIWDMNLTSGEGFTQFFLDLAGKQIQKEFQKILNLFQANQHGRICYMPHLWQHCSTCLVGIQKDHSWSLWMKKCRQRCLWPLVPHVYFGQKATGFTDFTALYTVQGLHLFSECRIMPRC